MAMVIPNNVGLTRIADHISRTLVTATWEIPWAVDLDGDGLDEMVLRTRHPDGHETLELLRWNGRKLDRSALGAGY